MLAMKLVKAVAVLSVASLSLSACVGSFTGGGANNLQDKSATQAEIANSTPSAFPIVASECPEIRIRPGAEAYAIYAKGQDGNAKGLRYQAVIDKQSRNCLVSNGLITVKMGVVGRLLTGPQGGNDTVNVPLRFAVERDSLSVFSQKYDIPITIAPPNQTEEFIKVVENVAIPYVGGEEIIIWVGFDPKG